MQIKPYNYSIVTTYVTILSVVCIDEGVITKLTQRHIHMMLFQLWPDPHPVQGACKCGRYLASSMASSCSERGSSEGLGCSPQSVRFFLTPSECTPLTRHEMLFHRQSDDLLPVLGMCIQYLNGKVNAHSSF